MFNPFKDNFDIFKKYLESQASGNARLQAVLTRMQSNGDVKIIDHRFMNIVQVTGPRTLFFEAKEIEETGIRNINAGKPNANECMLLTHVKIVGHTYAQDANVNSVYMSSAKYTNLIDVPGFQQGLLTIRSDSKIIVNQRPISDIVEEDGSGAGAERGTVLLDTPKFITPEAPLEMSIELNNGISPQRLLLKVELIGLCTTVQ